MEETALNQQQNTVTTEQVSQSPLSRTSPYIGFWARFAAFSIDSAIVGVLTLSVFMPIIFFIGFSGSDNALVLGLIQVLGLCISPLYFIYFTHTSQSTLGKRFIGIKVLSESGYKLSLGKIVLRETIGRIISGITLYIGYIIAGFTAKKQGLHDMISGSVVVPINPQYEISSGKIWFGIFIGFAPLLIVFVLVGIFIAALS